MCGEGRPEDNGFGIRVFAGESVDAYLQRASIQRGYVVGIWRGRHVVEPTHLADEEAASYWRDVLRVAAAVEKAYEPLKMNYLTQGNTLPHLHTHIVPRYETRDPNPAGPLPFPRTLPPPFPEEGLLQEASVLRELLS
jgi:diadenosine tetraphosphate (Ap4A) HIT family hydrolase